jgi:molecular chaperone GrpE
MESGNSKSRKRSPVPASPADHDSEVDKQSRQGQVDAGTTGNLQSVPDEDLRAAENGTASQGAAEEDSLPSAELWAEAEEKISALTAENAKLFDQLLRKQAEFENFRKRTEREKLEFMRFANFEIARDLLPALDGFERALKVGTPEALAGFKRGMEMVYKQLMDELVKVGLKPIESVGQKFDPNFHQAVVHEEHDDLEENLVIEEFQRGYLFQGRLLRAAMVKVAVGKKDPSEKDKRSGGTVIH